MQVTYLDVCWPASCLEGLAAAAKEVAQEVVARCSQDAFGVELHAFNIEIAMANAHHNSICGLCSH